MRLRKLLLALLVPLVIVGLTAQRFPNRRFNAPSSYLSFLQSTGPIALWPLDDPDTVCRNYGTLGTAANGTHTGVTPGQPGVAGRASLLYDGTADHTDVGTASLYGAATLAQLTVAGWSKVSGAGVWTDSSYDIAVFLKQATGGDYIQVYKKNTASTFSCAIEIGTTITTVDATLSTTGWFHWVAVLDKAGGTLTLYVNGAQADQDVPGAGVVNPFTTALIGAGSITPTLVWNGNLQFVSLWTRALSPAEVSALYSHAFQSANLEMEWDWLTPKKRLARVIPFPQPVAKPWRKAA